MKKAVRRLLLAILVGGAAGCQPQQSNPDAMKTDANSPRSTPEEAASAPAGKVIKSDEEWRRTLTPEQYRVLRHAGTELPNGPAYEEFKRQGAGTYVCGGCGAELFSSKHKFDSHCGWPSFYDPANAKNVIARTDFSGGMARTEVICAQCGGHLGHVFKGEGFDTPTDLRYCINGVSLRFIPDDKTAASEKGPR